MHFQYVEVCSVSTSVPVDIWCHMLLSRIFVCVKPLFWSRCQMLRDVIALSSANGKEGWGVMCLDFFVDLFQEVGVWGPQVSLSYELEVYSLMHKGSSFVISRVLQVWETAMLMSREPGRLPGGEKKAVAVTFVKFTNNPFLMCKAKLSRKISSD